MSHRGISTLKRIAVATVATTAIALGVGTAHAQYQKDGIDLMAQVTPGDVGASSGNDCWGYTSPSGRQYALMGYSNKMVVFEVTDPSNPVNIAQINHSNSTWGDIKVYDKHAYVCNESGGGIQIVDLTNVDSGTATLVKSFGPSTNHNIAINEDSGYLYTLGQSGNSGRTIVYDLADPQNPVEAGRMASGVGAYIHDGYISTFTSGPYAGQEIFFGGSEDRGVDIYDVTNKSAMTRLSRTSYPGVSYCHQLWTNADGTILYVDDELDELNGRTPTTRTLVFDVTDLSNPVLINTFTSGYPAVDHNLYVRDGFIFEANYTIGLRVFDANSDPVDPVEVGYFDTHPETNGADFNGLWSVYPYFDGSTVIGSDINRGMFVLDISGILAGLVFDYPGGRPNMISPDGGTSFTLNVSGRNVTHTEDTGLLHYNDGSGWNEVPLTYIGSGEYDVVFPATTCGEVVQYYVSAESDELGRETDPDGAPANSFSALSANGLTELFGDTFETDLGWTVENVDLQDGAWERGVPAGDGDRGDPLSDHDGSGSCYLTDNVAGNSDVDGGPTRLISPTFDLSDGDARVSYALWHSTDESDPMVTEISNNNGANWTVVENRTSSTGGWLVMSWDVSTYIAPTATMKVRFSVSDNPNDSVTESGLDAFTVERTNCGEPNNCLDLVVTNLVAGDKANWDVAGASAGGTVAVVYGLQSGKTVLDDHLDYCATFDIKGVNATRVICVKAADGNGDVHCTKNIPGNFAGVRVFSQAAERDTCPEECMSNLDDQTIQ